MQSNVVKLPVGPEEQATRAYGRGAVDEALTVLMEAYGEEVYRHCRQVLGEIALASDVHQTIFVQVYRDMANFSGRSSYRTWIYAIARHRCLDAIKMRKRRRLRFILGDSRAQKQAIDPRVSAREALEDAARSESMTSALQTLKPEARIAVLLRYREEMSFEEMSEICGERPKTLQARVARALLKLRHALEKEQ